MGPHKINVVLLISVIISMYVIVTWASTISQQFTPRIGRCLPLLEWNTLQFPPERGFIQPICTSVLQPTYSHVWIDASLASSSTTNPSDTCFTQTQLEMDLPIRQLANIFSNSFPSSECQRLLVSTICLYLFPKCNPEVDTPENGYLTEAQHKPCGWTCQLLRNDEICSQSDRNFLASHGLDLSSSVPMGLPYLDCSSRRWSLDQNCVALTRISQTPPRPRCETYTGSTCASLLSAASGVYIPPETTQLHMESLLRVFLDKRLLSFTHNSDCSRSQLLIYCQAMFRECNDVVLDVEIIDPTTLLPKIDETRGKQRRPLPLVPPTSSCLDLHDVCALTPFYKFISPLIDLGLVSSESFLPQCYDNWSYRRLDCLTSSSFSGDLSFLEPYETTPVRFAGFNSNIIGNAPASTSNRFVLSLPPLATCPTPLITPRALANAIIRDPTAHLRSHITFFGGTCALPCPSPIYSSVERATMDKMTDIFALLAMIFSGTLAISLLVFKSQRSKKILFWYATSFFFVPLVIFIGMRLNNGVSSHEAQCSDDVHLKHMAGFALFQSLVLVYFLLVSSQFWCLQALDLFLRLILARVYRRGSKNLAKRDIAFHLWCWFTPLISVAGLYYGGQLGYDGYLVFSFIAPDSSMTSPGINLIWPFFFFPVLLLAAIGFSFVTAIIIYLMRYDISASKLSNNFSNETTLPSKLRQFFKLLGFFFLIMFFIFFCIMHAAQLNESRPHWEISLERYAVCALTGSASCTLQSRMPPAMISAVSIAICSPGLFMFILYFLAQSDMWRLWAGKLGWSCLGAYAREDVITDGTSDFEGTRTTSFQGGKQIDKQRPFHKKTYIVLGVTFGMIPQTSPIPIRRTVIGVTNIIATLVIAYAEGHLTVLVNVAFPRVSITLTLPTLKMITIAHAHPFHPTQLPHIKTLAGMNLLLHYTIVRPLF